MGYIRLVHPDHFDHTRGRFNDLAFKRSSDGGMSVFDLACAEAASGGLICAHVSKFYPSIAGDPIIFYVIDVSELPAGHTVVQTPSDTGDDCHHEVEASNNALYKAFRSKRDWHHFQICDGGVARPLVEDDLAAFT